MSGEFERFRQVALEATKGDAEATNFLLTVIEVLHTWDDLIDRDRAITCQDINMAFIKALLVLPNNRFFLTYRAEITALLTVAIQNWTLATQVERGAEVGVGLDAAFIIRSSYVDLVTFTATALGGVDHGLAAATKVRALAHSEGFIGYRNNLVAERKAREGDA